MGEPTCAICGLYFAVDLLDEDEMCADCADEDWQKRADEAHCEHWSDEW